MAATCTPCEANGVGEDITVGINNLNFGTTDAPNIVPGDYPVPRGDNSFTKYLFFRFTGTWTDITNMKFWKNSGAYVTDEEILAAANVVYATPSQVGTGDSLIPAVVGSALAIESAEGENHIEYGASGVSGDTDYIRLQAQTSVSSPAGAVNQKVLRFQYDEI